MIVTKATTVVASVLVSVLSVGNAWIGSPRCHTCFPLLSSHQQHRHSKSHLPVQRSNFQEKSTSSSSSSSSSSSPITGSETRNTFFPWVTKETSSSTTEGLKNAHHNPHLQRVEVPSVLLHSTSSSKGGGIIEANDEDENNTSAYYVNNEREGISTTGAAAIAALAAVTTGMYFSGQLSHSNEIFDSAQQILNDPSAALEQVVQAVEGMGVMGPVYFGVAYTIAEILAIPAIPLTASAGYLFGPILGTSVVLLSASIAAAVSFGIGRTLLRDYVENLLKEYPDFQKIDRAIGKEGFKLMLLLRLSPIFPFALSNYLYGVTSINFSSFFWGTLFGFAPGTLAYVYTGYVGKALTTDGSEAYPWFVYAGGLAVFAGFLKVVADTATRIVAELEEEAEEEQ